MYFNQPIFLGKQFPLRLQGNWSFVYVVVFWASSRDGMFENGGGGVTWLGK
jgi:hypothetical protein